MPAWSPAIANAFIRMAAAEGKACDQMHLQELVYIAHGWCLALTGQPLTGDRPEAFEHGPEYRRLARALVNCGADPIRAEIFCFLTREALNGPLVGRVPETRSQMSSRRRPAMRIDSAHHRFVLKKRAG